MPVNLRVGLTGGIGSGKSTVASCFQKLGVPLIDTDIISREIVKPGKLCFKLIIDVFGSQILNQDGSLDRSKLKNVIFNDEKAKIKLEEILHPVIYKEIETQVSKLDYPYCLVAVPLLIETKAIDKFDRILIVDAPEHLQIDRASRRDNISPEIVKQIINTQVTRTERLKYADDVIDNDVKIDELDEIITKLHEKYLRLSAISN